MEESNLEEYVGGKLQIVLNTLFGNVFVSRVLEEHYYRKVTSYLGYYDKNIFKVLCTIAGDRGSSIEVKRIEGNVNVDNVKNLLVSSGVNCQSYYKIKNDQIKVNLMLDKFIYIRSEKSSDNFSIFGDNIEEILRTFWSYMKTGKLKNFERDSFTIIDLSVSNFLFYDIIPSLFDDFMDGNLSAEKLLEKSYSELNDNPE